MSSSSTTACSRSPSPATPATPESDTLEPVTNQQDLVPWLHSLSSNDFLIGSESPFAEHVKHKEGHILELGDIIQEEIMAEYVSILSLRHFFPTAVEPVSYPRLLTLDASFL